MARTDCSHGNSLEKIAGIFRALSEPTWLAIVRELKGRDMTVNEVVEATGSSQLNLSKQLRVLYDAGLLHRHQEGIYVRYCLADDLVRQLCELVCDRLNRESRAALTTYSI